MAARTKKAPGTAPAPKPALTVTAIVTVFLGADDGEGRVDVSLDMGGTDGWLVKQLRPATPKLNIAAAALRRIVVGQLAIKPMGKPADLLPLVRGAARA